MFRNHRVAVLAIKSLLKLLLAALLALTAVLAFNTWRVAPAAQAPPAGALPLDEAAAAQRLAGAIRIPTISYGERERIDPQAIHALHEYLRASFPRVQAALQREVVNGHSLLYSWPGSAAGAAPVLLLAHLDVVPVEPGTEGAWTHPPFAGTIADGFIWGRGAIDDKHSVLGLLEAAELLLAQGFQPARTILFAFGHDEEIGGREGAAHIARTLAQRGVKAGFLLDEAGAITHRVVASVERPIASIMAAEKGYASFRLTARADGGHSSMPPPQTAIGRLARALARLQDSPMPARIAPPVTDMLARIAPEMPLAERILMSNRWLFGPLLRRLFSGGPVTNALIRTTTAPTMIHGGIKDNVLPSEAWAVVNFRLLPGDSAQDVERHIRDTVDDPGVEVALDADLASEPSPVSSIDTPAFRAIERTVNQVFPEAVVTTGLVVAATDSRHYAGVIEQRYNFSPITLRPEDLARPHGTNERLGVHDYARAVQFYARLMMNAAGP